jgi:FkbM family methyltransferase
MKRQSILCEREVVLYGSGSAARDALEALKSAGIAVRRVFDHVGFGRQIDAIRVEDANGPDFNDAAARGLPLLVAIFNPHADISGILRAAEGAGWTHIYTFVDAFEELHQQLGYRFWLAPRSLWQEYSESMARCRSLFSDDRSLSVFDAVLKFRETGDYRFMPAPSPSDQYFPTDLPRWAEPMCLVDGGAFNGDTLRAALSHGYDLSHVYAFEPDLQNFRELTDYADSLSRVKLQLAQQGLWDKNEVLTFSGGASGASAIDAEGAVQIACVPLDEVSLGFAPTLLKLDIEGAELAALRGALHTILKHRPALAICVYHRPEDLWEIPLWAATHLPNYSFALRQHCYSGFDLVLYLIPQ